MHISRPYRGIHFIFVFILLWGAAVWAAQPAPGIYKVGDTTVTCLAQDAQLTTCPVPAQSLASAHKLFEEGVRLEHQGRYDVALRRFEAAAQQVPESVEFSTAREIVRQRLVFDHIEKGNAQIAGGHAIEAEAEYQTALSIDPDNTFARERLEEAMPVPATAPRQPVEIVEDSGLLEIKPKAGVQDFHLRGDSRDVLTKVAGAFGVTVIFEDNVRSRPVRFDIEQVDFYTAMQTVSDLTRTFWTPMDAQQVYIAPENPENHRLYDRMVYRTFYMPGTPLAEMTDVVTTLKTIFDLRFVNLQVQSATISVRAPQRSMDSVTQLIESLSYGRPQVVLDVQVIEISRAYTRNLGLDGSPQFNLFNIPAGALAGLLGANSQDLINQLIAGGGINQAGNTTLAALLAQLQSQQSSLFSQPLATFGGGKTLFGVALPATSFNFAVSDSDVRSLQRSTLRAASGDTATMKIGSRYPILNSSFAPIFNSASISRLIGNNSFRAPFPSFNFEDLGLLVKAKPSIHEGGDVTMELEMELKALGTQSFNGVPVISNRQYKGTIRVQDGEPAVLVGMVTSSEQKSYHGVPGVGQLPLLRELTSGSSHEHEEDCVVGNRDVDARQRGRGAEG